MVSRERQIYFILLFVQQFLFSILSQCILWHFHLNRYMKLVNVKQWIQIYSTQIEHIAIFCLPGSTFWCKNRFACNMHKYLIWMIQSTHSHPCLTVLTTKNKVPDIINIVKMNLVKMNLVKKLFNTTILNQIWHRNFDFNKNKFHFSHLSPSNKIHRLRKILLTFIAFLIYWLFYRLNICVWAY